MINKYVDDLNSIIEAVDIKSWHEFSVAGRSIGKIKKEIRDKFSPNNQKSYLTYHLQKLLYESCYCYRIGSNVLQKMTESNRSAILAFVTALSNANTGTGCWEMGWRVNKIDESGRIAAEKEGLTLYLWPGQFHATQPYVSVNDVIKVRVGKEYHQLSPGFYMSLGNTDGLGDAENQVLRFYWNTSAEGAIKLMYSLTTHLNNAGISFKFKTVKDPIHYSRRDSSVLYIEKREFPKIKTSIKNIYNEQNEYLNKDVPLFTKVMAPGLGLAEDPSNGQSFGEHRCQLVADGLWSAHQNNAKSPEERLNEVIKSFQNSNISLESPYLNPGSTDMYQF